jgi:hypothetical protein
MPAAQPFIVSNSREIDMVFFLVTLVFLVRLVVNLACLRVQAP